MHVLHYTTENVGEEKQPSMDSSIGESNLSVDK